MLEYRHRHKFLQTCEVHTQFTMSHFSAGPGQLLLPHGHRGTGSCYNHLPPHAHTLTWRGGLVLSGVVSVLFATRLRTGKDSAGRTRAGVGAPHWARLRVPPLSGSRPARRPASHPGQTALRTPGRRESRAETRGPLPSSQPRLRAAMARARGC